MTRQLTIDHPCRLDLECPDDVPAPGAEPRSVLPWLFNVRGKTILDLHCGCGIIAIAAAKLGAADVWAVDPSTAAVDCTRRNADRNGVEVVAKRGDLFEPVEGRTFDLIVALPAPTPGATELDADGLGFLASVVRHAPDALEAGGQLLTCVPGGGEAPRFETMLDERFRFRRLPETRAESADGRVFFLRSYLAMKR